MGILLKMLVKNIKISTWCLLGAIILTLFTPLTSGIKNATFHYAYSGLCFVLIGVGIIFLIVEWLSSKRKSLSTDKEVLVEEKDELSNMLRTLAGQLGNPTMFDDMMNTKTNESNDEASKENSDVSEEENITEMDAVEDNNE